MSLRQGCRCVRWDLIWGGQGSAEDQLIVPQSNGGRWSFCLTGFSSRRSGTDSGAAPTVSRSRRAASCPRVRSQSHGEETGFLSTELTEREGGHKASDGSLANH